jgi:hypothetical protein
MPARSFPIAPLLDWVYLTHEGSNEHAQTTGFRRSISDVEISAMLGCNRATLGRLRVEGWIDMYTADRWAVRLGLHPLLIWPDFHGDTVWADELELVTS